MSSINPTVENSLDAVKAKYPVQLSKPLQVLCKTSDAVAQQFMPSIKELQISTDEFADPIGDSPHTPVKGVIHRYPNRVLLTLSVNCPSYCRFCFRKARVGQELELTDAEVDSALDYIKNDPKIDEVILSGGEPLMLSVKLLNDIFRKLDQITQIKVIRIHTRIQLTGPDATIQKLNEISWPKKQFFVVIHCNHPDEIDQKFRNFTTQIKKKGGVLLSQSVLLKSINDNAPTLNQLFSKLVRHGVIPYYLHHPDLVKGAGHFRVSLKKGMALMKALQGEISGYAIPQYILDLPGGYGKVPINESWIEKISDTTYEIRSPFGQKITYSDCSE